ncbi:MAG: hypothetical protein AAGA16_14870 [Cyanobacteria bacterium P01_E01_bin.35]
MSHINLYPQAKPIESAVSKASVATVKCNSWSSKIIFTKLNYAELLRKLTYTFINIFTRPKYFLVFAFARFNTVRQIYLLLSKLWSNSTTTAIIHRDSSSLFSRTDTKSIVRTLKQDGIFLGFSLPQDFLSELMQYLSTQNCYGGGHPEMGFRISDKAQLDRVFSKPFYVARYFNISQDCPQITQLINDSKLREIATGYIGKQAKYTGSSLFWTFPIEGESCDADQQKFRYFHYDIDDFSGLRFCFYLTDVTLDDGPHVCIRGSHLKKPLLHVLNYFSRIQTETELTKVYDSKQFITITGNSGFGFIEDTFCFHKGNPPQKQPRLFLQLHFAAHNYNEHQAYLDERDPNTLKSNCLPEEICVP